MNKLYWPTNFDEKEIRHIEERSSSLAGLLTGMSILSIGIAGILYCLCRLVGAGTIGILVDILGFFVSSWVVNKHYCRLMLRTLHEEEISRI
jgi:hypothetical protein